MITRKNTGTAIAMMAVLLIGLWAAGCATKRDAAEIKDQIRRIEMQQTANQQTFVRMDSLITSGAEADLKLRNELRYSVDAITQQMTDLLQNYNDLMQRIDQLSRQETTTHVIRSSPGVQGQAVSPTGPEPDQPAATPVVPGINCDSTYDDSFILTRRSEYDAAIEGFGRFIAGCGDHPNIADAYYWRGQCFYLQKKYDEAIAEFEIILKDHKNSPKVSEALYKIARCKEDQGKTADAKRYFQQLVDDHPGTFSAEQAKARLKELK